MKSFRKFGKLGNLFKNFLSSNNDWSIFTILDENGNALANVAIQIKRGSYTYVDVTDENGNARLKGAFTKDFDITLAKSGIEQVIITDVEFDAEVELTYEQIPKTTWDGMYAGTKRAMYVDVHDGGHAIRAHNILVKDSSNNPLPNTTVEISSGDYDFIGISDENGIVSLEGSDGNDYDVLLARSGVNQKSMNDWTFEEGGEITYAQEEKDEWDGMYSNTDQRMYVDEHDGGQSSN